MKIQEIRESAEFGSTPALPARESLRRRGRALWQQLIEAGKRRPKSLRMCESLSLGDRRFVAVVAYERSRFLLGGTSGSLVLLARLEDGADQATTPEDNRPAHSSEEPRR
jgi:flagellar biogenesis protein FliO